ncbi:hypothetical protein [Pseudomonas multiresinivorans]|uniref:DUF2721 domain-containing protein n=1 Tax=Pseudomonas multiresinivorans TaxID=95301 RepID=A0A7Z3BPI1_9PSED|nr:hypothetical protein [Pseudomonas multiresinivorans]QJP10484.1 hypothetical protein G4G71_22300 [Pseudomonas multiresinivorans]
MNWLIQLGHIVGVAAAWMALGAMALIFRTKIAKRMDEAEAQDIVISLGLSYEELDNPENKGLLLRTVQARNSTDLLANRLSDAAGTISTFVGYAMMAVYLAIAIWVVWLCWEERKVDLVLLWCIPALMVLEVLAMAIFSLTVRLLTGKLPGQAKAVRKELSKQMLQPS